MNALAAIEFYRVALLRLVEQMFASAGIVAGGDPVATLPKPVRLLILRVLVPAESAVRRMIEYVADRMAGPLAEARSGSSKKKRGKGDGSGDAKKTSGKRAAVFRLFDRMKYFAELSDWSKRFRTSPLPRILSFDDWKPAPQPAPKTPRDPDDASRICRRLQALFRALNDIQGQADRLRRAMAKREKAPPGPGRHGPRRPGWPPGYRPTHTHEVDGLLYECDILVRQVWKPRRS